MKVIIFVVFCTFAVAIKGSMTKEEALETMRTLAADCLKELGASEANFDEMVKNEPATSMDTKCLRACVMKAINVLTADGKMNRDNALKMAEMHSEGDADKIKVANDVIDVCEGISVPDDHCEAAEMYKMCLLSEAKKRGVTV